MSSPICSAGVGRTGTIIGLDICLDQLQTEGRVDVRSVVSFLREQRTQMVQTQVQCMKTGYNACRQGTMHEDRVQCMKTGYNACRQGTIHEDRVQCMKTGYNACRQGTMHEDRVQCMKTGYNTCRQGTMHADRDTTRA